MSATNNTYRRLPGRGRSWLGSYRLYEGPDHLLQVCSTGYSESYKRFYFRDVQAVVVQRNQRQRGWTWIWGGLLTLCAIGWGAGLAAFSFEMGWMIFGLGAALVCLVPLVANLLLGSTCSCHVRTAVHFEKLGALKRVRTTEQAIQRIKSLVETAQGPFPTEPLEQGTLLAVDAPPVMDASPIVEAPPVARAAQPLRHYEAGVHLILCWLLLVDLPVTVLDYFAPTAGQTLALILLAATILAALMGVAKQHQTDLPASLRRLPWLVLAMFGVGIAVVVGYAVQLGFQGKLSAGDDLSVWNDPVLLPLTVVSTGISVLGALGLIEVRRWRSVQPANPPPLAPPEPPPPAQP